MYWTVLSSDHNCDKTREFARLTNKSTYIRQCTEPDDNSLFLPFRSYNEELFDILTLEKVHNLILNYRLAEAASSIITYHNLFKPVLRVSQSQNLYHTNDETQIPN